MQSGKQPFGGKGRHNPNLYGALKGFFTGLVQRSFEDGKGLAHSDKQLFTLRVKRSPAGVR
jgi:hypothetical protein